MPSFSYIARSANGTLEKGTIKAKTSEAAREILRKQSFMVEEMKQDDEDAQPIAFASMPWVSTDDTPSLEKKETPQRTYAPLIETIRIFTGWLLAWYALVYLMGSLRQNGRIPFDVPFLQGLFESPLVLRFTFATFLFLCFSSLHQWMGKGTGKGIILGIVGVLLVVLFHVNG